MSPIAHRIVDVAGLNVFYREAGHRKAPVVLLLHGFPTSSRMFRGLIPVLADHYRVIAPDLPGFGFTDAPDRASVAYTFEHLTDVVDRFTEVLELTRFTIFVFDYGAPIGFRLALRHPERITAIITQNGNAYEEGLSEGWNPIQAYWREPTQKNRAVLRDFLRPETTKWQYTHGVADESLVAPESYTLDSALLARPGNDEIQLDLFLDYASNVALYPISKLTYGRTVRRCLRSGARTIRFSCPRARKRSSATYRMPRSVSTTRAISRWRRMARRSPPRLASSLSDCLVPKQLQPDRREPYLGGAGQTMTVPPRRSSLAPGRFTMSTDIISLTDVGGPPARTGAVVSVQVGQVAPLGPDGVASGFVKAPVAGPVAVGRLGMAG
jgi:pimeloyl-ACP methyl ester carboxylesterase